VSVADRGKNNNNEEEKKKRYSLPHRANGGRKKLGGGKKLSPLLGSARPRTANDEHISTECRNTNTLVLEKKKWVREREGGGGDQKGEEGKLWRKCGTGEKKECGRLSVFMSESCFGRAGAGGRERGVSGRFARRIRNNRGVPTVCTPQWGKPDPGVN